MNEEGQDVGANEQRASMRELNIRRKDFRVTTIKYLPCGAEELRRQFAALFDILGLSDELFDIPPKNNKINIKR